MSEKEKASAMATMFFEDLWAKGDYWLLETDPYEQQRFAAMEDLISGRRYGRVLEIGCGGGAFTKRLAPLADQVVALDISAKAIARARRALADFNNVELRTADVMTCRWREQPSWDLIVLSETIYYLGWIYPMFDVGWLGHELHFMSNPGGRLLLANTQCVCNDYLVLPWLIDTYHDLYRNLGFAVEKDEIFRGAREGTELTVKMTLFRKPGREEPVSGPELRAVNRCGNLSPSVASKDSAFQR